MKPEPVTRINLVWYIVPVLPIGIWIDLCITGVLPALALLLGIFLAMFWLLSLLFALYALWRQARRQKRKAVSS